MALFAALATLQVAGNLFTGINNYNQTKKQARVIEANANEAADLNDYNTNLLRERQKLLFASSGFSLEGSPALILQDTLKRGQEESNRIRRNGYNQAKALKRSGRNQLISSFIGSGSDILTTRNYNNLYI